MGPDAPRLDDARQDRQPQVRDRAGASLAGIRAVARGQGQDDIGLPWPPSDGTRTFVTQAGHVGRTVQAREKPCRMRRLRAMREACQISASAVVAAAKLRPGAASTARRCRRNLKVGAAGTIAVGAKHLRGRRLGDEIYQLRAGRPARSGPNAARPAARIRIASALPSSPLDLLDFGSFSSLWYWLFLGSFWARVMHAPMGVPAETVRAALPENPSAARDLAMLTSYEVGRHHAMARALGPWRAALWAFTLSGLAVLATGYGIELAQAAALIATPFALVRWRIATAVPRLAAAEGTAALRRQHLRLRLQVQTIGIGAVFVTALWGMIRTLAEHTI